jgi:D-glycero-D-manno-heptose 1,7-bisphosphate phosphatase
VAAMRRAVFLDRDGTLNRPPAPGDYLRRADEVELLGGAAAAVALLARAGYLCVLASNQRGVALGLMSDEELASVDARLRGLLAAGGAELSRSYYCTHGSGEGCGCRKPEPGLLLRAANELEIELGASWMVGDTPTDLEAGVRAGCRTLRVLPVDGGLLAAAQTILADDQQREAA